MRSATNCGGLSRYSACGSLILCSAAKRCFSPWTTKGKGWFDRGLLAFLQQEDDAMNVFLKKLLQLTMPPQPEGIWLTALTKT